MGIFQKTTDCYFYGDIRKLSSIINVHISIYHSLEGFLINVLEFPRNLLYEIVQHTIMWGILSTVNVVMM